MKFLLIKFTLIFTVMFSSPSYSEWTKVAEGVQGDMFYVDLERIRKVDGYVYFWSLSDYVKPISGGVLSSKTYVQADCKLFRFEVLSYSHHKEPMGGGIGETNTLKQDWVYPTPHSVNEYMLNAACMR